MTNPETYNKIVTIGVDIQNDFCPGGSLGVDQGDEVIAPFNAAADWARQHEGTVVLTRDWHPTQTDHFKTWPPHCVQKTEGAAFHPDLDLTNVDHIINKGTGTKDDAYSGFEGATKNGKNLETIIAELQGPERQNQVAVVIGGLATDYCIKETVLDACKLADISYPIPHRLGVFVLEDAIRAVNLQPEDGQQAIDEMKLHGARFITTQTILAGGLHIEEA